MSNPIVSAVRRFATLYGDRSWVVGLVWGFLEASMLIAGGYFGYLLGHVLWSYGIIQTPVDQFLVFLMFIIALLSGYALRDPEKSIKAFLISQVVAFFPIFSLLYLSPSTFHSVDSSAYAFDPSVYAAGLVVLSFVLGMAGCLVGSLSGEPLSHMHRTYHVSLNNYRLVLIAILLLVLALGSAAFVDSLNLQNASLASDNQNLRDTIKSIYGYSNLTYSSEVAYQLTKSWQQGVANITLYSNPGFNYGLGIPHPGYLAVSWNSTSSLTFNFNVYNVTVRTPGTTSGSYNIPVLATPSNFSGSGWFHNETCSL